jgi:chromate reductase, NAD(P)H dehydrogenase (quinone)
MKILGISGSLRRDSYNTALLRNTPLEVELWDELKAIPPYDEDDDVEPAPAAVARMRAAVAGADAILFATPEYNASIPGQLKNAIDWLSRPRATSALRNKPVAVVGASTGAFGAVWAQAELRKVLATAGARVVEGDVAVGHAHEHFDQYGRLLDESLREQLQLVVQELVGEVAPRVLAAA